MARVLSELVHHLGRVAARDGLAHLPDGELLGRFTTDRDPLAQADGQPANVAVVDGGGNLVAFARMDGAWLGSIDIAIKKAKTARFFDMASGEIGKLSQPGGPLFNIEHSNNGLISFPGGVPLK